MKQVVICSATLALALIAAPSYGDNWERQLDHRDMMMANQVQMSSDWGPGYSVASVEKHRRMMLERGVNNTGDYMKARPQSAAGYATASGELLSIEDIENLPATAAGYEERNGLLQLDGPPERRRHIGGAMRYRGGMKHGF